MIHVLRKLLSSDKSLVRVAAIATAGSSFLYANCNLDSDKPISKSTLSVSLSWPQSLPLLWKFENQGLLPISAIFNNPQFRVQGLPLHFSSVNPVPSLDKQKETAGVTADNQKSSAQWIGRHTIANAAASVSPAVVNLSATRGYWGIASAESIGSGTIIDKDGTILTCAHVVIDFQGTRPVSKGVVEVALQDGRTFKGTVLHADLHSDIAIVKINSESPLPSAKLGSSSKLRPGEWVLAVGCPLTLQNTVTAGIVSCVDRKSSDLGLGGTRREYLQTDCAINAGNSGGPLINIDGEIVGVNIMKVHAADGLSFAVPIDSVTKIMEQFKKSGRVVRPWLGLKMVELNEMIVAQLKERDPAFPNVSKGVLIPMVTPGSPGDRAGFRPGDVVVEFDGNPIKNIKEIIEIMGDRVGESLKVVVKRSNESSPLTLIVTPEECNPSMSDMLFRHLNPLGSHLDKLKRDEEQ